MRLNYFNFKELEGKYLLTNDLGSHLFVSLDDFKKIIKKDVDLSSELGKKLLQRNMVYNATNLEYSSRLMYDLRDIKGHVTMSTSLHIFVVTTAYPIPWLILNLKLKYIKVLLKKYLLKCLQGIKLTCCTGGCYCDNLPGFQNILLLVKSAVYIEGYIFIT